MKAGMNEKVSLQEIADKMGLRLLNEGIDLKDILISYPDVNRPALQLIGYFDTFYNRRLQIIGGEEFYYLEKLESSDRLARYEEIFKHDIPCLIFCRGNMPKEGLLNLASKYKVPVLWTDEATSDFISETLHFLKERLAPRITVHGVLIDVYGEGVLITGDSGIGKSEAALELIKRGHRLISDDAVVIKKVSNDTLIGSAPGITKNIMELRGIGMIDVKMLFGIQSILEYDEIDLVVKLEEWNAEVSYDRLGLVDEYQEYLGNKIVCNRIPVRPGRNIAVIIETAAINKRQKQMGYNTAKILQDRIEKQRS